MLKKLSAESIIFGEAVSSRRLQVQGGEGGRPRARDNELIEGSETRI